MFAHIVANYIPKYDQLLPFWELVDDCYAGTIAVKSPEKMERYLRKFPVEARNGVKQEQYHLRCWAADYDNIFKDGNQCNGESESTGTLSCQCRYA